MITSFTNYFFPSRHMNIPFPEGAVIKTCPEISEFIHQEGGLGSWKVTILNHTNFDLHFIFGNYFRKGSFAVPNMSMRYDLSRVVIAYEMENLPHLFFYETHFLDSSYFFPARASLKYYIDTNDTPFEDNCCLKFRPFSRSDAEKKIAEIAAKFTQRRTNLELVLKGYSDNKSILSELQIPRDIISHIAKLYCDVLKNEMQST